jgi:hypothetical protein
MRRSSGPRKTAWLSESVRQQLNRYALAGVGMLALAQSAEGRIVYTPAHIKLTPNHKFRLTSTTMVLRISNWMTPLLGLLPFWRFTHSGGEMPWHQQ